MASWVLSEVQSGLVIKSVHVRNASNDWQGDVAANGNALSGVLTVGVNQTSTPTTPSSGTIVVYLDSADGLLKLKKSSGTVVSLESGGTLTGTYDAEGMGNTLTLPFVMSFPAAKVQNGTAQASFSCGAAGSGAPTPTAVVGTNTMFATLSFADTETESVQDRFRLPADWSGNIDVDITWRCAVTAGSVVWQIQTAGVADGSTGDPSFNTANTVTDAAKGTANQFNTCTISNITTTGVSASGDFFFKFLRDPSNGSDNLGAAAELISLNFKVRRAI